MPYRLSTFACLLLLWPAAAQESPGAKPDGKLSVGREHRGMVWRIEGGKSAVFLGGSIHLLRKEDHPLPATYEAAYAASEQLYFEIPPSEINDPKVAAKMLAAAALPAGKKLEDLLSPESAKLIRDWKTTPEVRAMISEMKPAMAALTVIELEYARLGILPEFGVEKFLETKAAKDKKEVRGLETVDFQLGLFLDMPMEQQDQLVRETFQQLGRAGKIMKEMIGWWRTGDDAALGKAMIEEFADYPEIEKSLLLNRNADWAPKIEKLLAGEKSTLVVVGAGHLCGKENVIELLRKRGWKISRVEATGTADASGSPSSVHPKTRTEPQ